MYCSMITFRIAFFLLLAAPALWAHDPGLSSANITLGREKITLQLLFAHSDLEALADSSAQTFAAERVRLETAAGELLPAVDPQKVIVGEDTQIQIFYDRIDTPAVWYRAAFFAELPLGHRQVLTVRDEAGTLLLSRLLGAQDSVAEIALASSTGDAQSPPAQAQLSTAGFLILGVEHILTGYDHLLFLFALLLVCDGFATAAKIITCFTIAHSLTLALATFNLVQMSSAVVEPLIAASIIYVGVENVFFRRKTWRYGLTFIFGLIHGLGFAGILRELGVGSSGAAVAGPLFSFNLGVELGQLAIAALVLPLILWLRRKPVFVERGVPALSLLVAAAGAYWLIERTLL